MNLAYRILLPLIKALYWIFNGRIIFKNRDVLPKDDSYIIVGPHRSYWDPVYLALTIYPITVFTVIAKEELTENPVINFALNTIDATLVNRENPGTTVIKRPVKQLKKERKALIMFPTGSRYSNDLKGGMLLIAKMSGKAIIPASYIGPTSFGEFFKRKRTLVGLGQPIYVDRKSKLTDEEQAEYMAQVQEQFDQIDKDLSEISLGG